MNIGVDLDGTIITCKEKQCALMKSLCKAYGISLDQEQWWYLKRQGLSGMAALTTFGIPQELSRKIATTWENQIESWPWLDFDQLFPDSSLAIHEWAQLGHQLHLISSRNNIKAALQQLARLFPTSPFTTTTFVPRHSPNTKADYIQLHRVDLYIGDTEQDDQAAHLADVQSYLVSTGMRSPEFLSTNTGGRVIHCLSNLSPFLL